MSEWDSEASERLPVGGRLDIDNITVMNDVPVGHTNVYYGPELTRGQRGAIIADDWGLAGSGTQLRIEWLQPSDTTYRLAFLFNQVVTLPTPQNPLEQADPWGLIERGALSRTHVEQSGVVLFNAIRALEATAYQALDDREPGAWSLWHEPGYDPVPEQLRTPKTAVRVRLQEALVIPSIEVPFQDVIEFRERNASHLSKLRQHLDELAIKISASGPDAELFRLEMEKLEQSIAEYTEEARKPNWKKGLAGLGVTIDWAAAIRNSLTGGAVANFVGLPLPQAAVVIAGNVATAISVETTRGMKGASWSSPFEYIGKIHREFL